MSPASSDRALPRGPHGLSRDEVSRSQRERLLEAMTAAVAEKGFAKTVVADVVVRSGVSRATFYEQFRDKEDCFQAAYEANAARVAQLMEAGLSEVRDDPERSALDKLDFVQATHAGEKGLVGTRRDQRFAAEVIVGAVSSMVTTLVGVGETDRLPDLRAPLTKLAREVLRAR